MCITISVYKGGDISRVQWVGARRSLTGIVRSPRPTFSHWRGGSRGRTKVNLQRPPRALARALRCPAPPAQHSTPRRLQHTRRQL
ncbi:unnamed protein product, partial [Brenthis ino]